jgi:hypothetical protein|eukprot:COSAG06_NODE_228_length_19725_cov_8.167839_17_plen_78_part_00
MRRWGASGAALALLALCAGPPAPAVGKEILRSRCSACEAMAIELHECGAARPAQRLPAAAASLPARALDPCSCHPAH